MEEALVLPTDTDCTCGRGRRACSARASTDPRFRAGLEALRRIAEASARARRQGGVLGGVRRAGLALRGALTFGRLYLLPARANVMPPKVRAAPVW